jgi:DNA-binding Lrp family transcriptional regulator
MSLRLNDMDDLDKKILNFIQTKFPVAPEPYRLIGEKIGLSEDEVIERIRKMKEDGIIRRIGAVFDSGKLGFVSTLCAARVPEKEVKRFVDVVNTCPGVTHNYRRNHEYNIWFTFIAPDEETQQRALAEIAEKTGVRDILSMKAVRTFKINASFEL